MAHARAARRPCALCALLLLAQSLPGLAAVDDGQRRLDGWRVSYKEGRHSSASPEIVDTAAKEPTKSQEAHPSRQTSVEASASQELGGPSPVPAPASEPASAAPASAARALPPITKKQALRTPAAPDVNLVLSPVNSVPAESPVSQARKADTHVEPATTVLQTVAMCDSLACPAGYQLRPSAFEKMCTSFASCSLDADLDRCCHQKESWWTYMMAELAIFCCLSMLCSTIGGLVHHYFPMPSRRRSWHEGMDGRRPSKEPKDQDEEEKDPLTPRTVAVQAKTNETSLPVIPMAVPSVHTTRMVSGSFGQVSQGSFLSPPGSQGSFLSPPGSQHQLMRPGQVKAVNPGGPLPGMPQIGAGFGV